MKLMGVMDDRIDRLRAVGQSEFHANQKEWHRLRQLADMILDTMEYHAKQMDTWNQYLGSLATPEIAAVVLEFPTNRADSRPPEPA